MTRRHTSTRLHDVIHHKTQIFRMQIQTIIQSLPDIQQPIFEIKPRQTTQQTRYSLSAFQSYHCSTNGRCVRWACLYFNLLISSLYVGML